MKNYREFIPKIEYWALKSKSNPPKSPMKSTKAPKSPMKNSKVPLVPRFEKKSFSTQNNISITLSNQPSFVIPSVYVKPRKLKSNFNASIMTVSSTPVTKASSSKVMQKKKTNRVFLSPEYDNGKVRTVKGKGNHLNSDFSQYMREYQ